MCFGIEQEMQTPTFLTSDNLPLEPTLMNSIIILLDYGH